MKQARANRLIPNGIPRYVRCYDNGGRSCDRYTVVFTGNYRGRKGCDYVAMNASPFHPQGFGQHGWHDRVIDRPRSSRLGRRLPFIALPSDCQKLVMQDYCSMWNIGG